MNTKEEIKGKKVTVMGLGVHGGAIGNIQWLHKRGAKVLVTDLKEGSELGVGLEKIKRLEGIELVLGEHRERDFAEADLVIRNPAVPRNSKWLEVAREAGVPVEMDSSLFIQLYPGEIIGVTGTKGKSTTTSVIARLLDIPAVGIEGTSPLAILDEARDDSTAAFELSSWRLEALNGRDLAPDISVVTSIYRDHLNSYSSFAEYEETKKIIVKNQKRDDIAILNGDDPLLERWQSEIKGKLWWYGLTRKKGNGIYVVNGQIVVVVDGADDTIMDRAMIPFRYDHELRNVLPGFLIGYLKRNDGDLVKTRLSNLKTLPHRMEQVLEFKGVEYINDSAATMPDATIAALQALGNRKIVHILGGNDKELDFTQWAKLQAKADIRYLIWLPGNITDEMKRLLGGQGVGWQSYDASSMNEAVEKAAAVAKSGDVVLMSPGATSFGSFKNEFDRGDKFKEAVRRLT